MSVLAIAFAGLAACGDDGGSTTEELTCASYCTTIQRNCTDANAQFMSEGHCTATCATFPMGALADRAGNTLGCRLYHSGAAEMDATVHCRHAGPGGDAACGMNCEGFCSLVIGACTGANAQYGGQMAQCMTACAGFATTPPYSSTVQSGNSFACRLYHATAAAMNPAMHCSHTAATGGPCS